MEYRKMLGPLFRAPLMGSFVITIIITTCTTIVFEFGGEIYNKINTNSGLLRENSLTHTLLLECSITTLVSLKAIDDRMQPDYSFFLFYFKIKNTCS